MPSNSALTVPVFGMHCASCANIITRKLTKLEGVESVSVNFATEKASIVYDPAKISIAGMNREIGKLGYSLENIEFQSAVHEAKDDLHTHPMHSEMTTHTSDHVMPDGTVMSGMDHSAHLGLNQTKEQKLKELEKQKHLVEVTFPISVLMFVLTIWDLARTVFPLVPPNPIPMSVLNPLLLLITTPILFGAGRIFLEGVVRFIKYGAANMDTLVGLGTLSAFLYSTFVTLFPGLAMQLQFPEYTYFDVTIVIIGFILLGKYLEARSKLKTGEAIEKLMGLQAKTALIERDGKEIEIPVDQVVAGDVMIVKPGQKVPVDGVVVSGSSTIDESMVTGESIPVTKGVTDTVIGSTLNKQGILKVKARRVGSETMLAQIIAMVESAQGSKAPIEAIADTVSSIFVPVVLGLAIVTFIVWVGAGFLGLLPLSEALSRGFVATVGILVIACPCALGLATPTAIIVGTGKGASKGILIKDATALETLHKATAIVFDKTGTLTQGKPEVTAVVPASGFEEKYVLFLAASLEKNSAHPLADAIVSRAQQAHIALSHVDNFLTVEGKGVEGNIKNESIRVGNQAYMDDQKIDVSSLRDEFSSLSSKGQTVMLVSSGDKIAGLIAVADVIKPESKEAIQTLRTMHIHTAMITGDHSDVANAIAKQLGIDTVFAQVLPAEKADKVKELQSKGYVVAMVGDGINDAPALAQADVGVAMGTGTDVAIEAADITLLKGNLEKLTAAIMLSKKTFAVIKQNLVWAFGYNIIGIPVAAGILYPLFGLTLSPVFAGAAMALSSVSVVTNSLRLKNSKI